MAYTPCPVDGKMYKGTGISAYPALLNGLDELRKPRKFCPTHWAEIQEAVLSKCLIIQDGIDFPQGHEGVCSFCGQTSPADSLAGLFVTWYEKGKDREDAYARVCAGCYDQVAGDLALDVA